MKKMQFSIEIHATKEKVWDTLWQDKTFREWANIIDEGTYLKGVLEEGKEIQFISAANGYGVTSLIEKLVPNEFVLFRHQKDTQDSGAREREKDWSGGTESHTLSEKEGVTTLTVAFDVPAEMEEIFHERFPRAMTRIKELAEETQ